VVVRVTQGNQAMSPFDAAHITSYPPFIETMRLFRTVFEIEQFVESLNFLQRAAMLALQALY